MKGVDRTPYLGDVAVVVHPGKKESGTPLADTPTRPVTRHGGMRDLHESSFSLSGKSLWRPGAGGEPLGQAGSPVPAACCCESARSEVGGMLGFLGDSGTF